MLKQNPRLDAALEYVRRWEIFPVPPGLKCGYSVEKRGFDNGKPWGKTTSVKEVRAYWRRLPRANVGLVMGAGSGIWDLEIDTKAAHANLKQDGAVSLAELEAKYGKLPPTSMFESPSGSRHHLFMHPGGGDVRIMMGPLDKEKYPGIDVKGDGGMSIVPPSRTKKGMYRWLNKRRVVKAPAWLLGMVVKQDYAPSESDPFTRFAKSTRQPSISELTLAVAMIANPELPWDPDKSTSTPGWNAIGMAIFDASGGSVEGYRLFDAFSQRSSKYDAGNTRRKWKAFHGCPPRKITAGTIFHLAEKAVPNWRERIIARDPKVIRLLREFHKLLGEPTC
jgi:hypothetical protein